MIDFAIVSLDLLSYLAHLGEKIHSPGGEQIRWEGRMPDKTGVSTYKVRVCWEPHSDLPSAGDF